ncbi:MAG: TorF family putative porin [Magnetococcus sp. YQC-5]
MNMIRKLSGMLGILIWAMIVVSSQTGLADTAKATPAASPHTFTPNVGVVSNYVFRGLTQTWNKPAIQGGIDYAHAQGWYAGVWASSISDKQYANGWAELDLSGGFNGKINNDWTWTVGGIGVYYPSANYDHIKPAGTYPNQSYDTFEVNAGVGYKWVTLKLSASLTDYYGANTKTGYNANSKGTTYLDLTATVPLPESVFTKDVTLPLHIGRTNYPNKLLAPTAAGTMEPDYTDVKLGINKAFDGGWNLGAAYTYASNKAFYNGMPSAKNSSDTINMGGGNVMLALTKTF